MDLCEHGLEPGLCDECNPSEATESTFTPVDDTASYAERLKAEHPTWFVKNLGWGVIAYDPKDYED